jgi:hypothetical protein
MAIAHRVLGVVLSAVLLLCLTICASACAAEFGIAPSSFSATPSGVEAGEHADLTVTFALNQEPVGDPTGYLKDIAGLTLPPGLVGDPYATPKCEMGKVEKGVCPEETAVGVAEVAVANPPKFSSVSHLTALVYNITPYPEEPAAYAFYASGLSVRLDASLPVENRYGLRLSADDLSDAKPVISATITLWGVPADHNGPLCQFNEATEEEECAKYGGPGSGSRLPFLSNPVTCDSASPQERESVLSVTSWQSADASPADASTVFAPLTDCEGLQFEPSISVSPEQTQAREPSGYGVVLKMPGNDEPDERAAADLHSARIELPIGTVISPSATTGLQACPDEVFDIKGSTPASCPADSQIGSASIRTPLLGEPMQGQLFLGTPECEPCTSQDAQEGKMIRVLVQGSGSGVVIKLAGSISVDQGTSRLTLTLDESPQLPVEEMKLTLSGGEKALLANPDQCTTPLSATAQLTPYNTDSATRVSGSSFQATGCGTPQFAPTLAAGTVSNQAATSSPAVVSISRTDQDQSLERFTVQMPPGLLGLLSTVPNCPPAADAANACPAGSQVGDVTVAAGPGSEPLYLKGAAFLTGPQEGAPFGLAIVVPALAGPIDLGTIAIKAGIQVNPVTAALTIASGSIPQSLAGIPLQIRNVTLDIDRPGFIVNPTDCRPMAIGATLLAAGGDSSSAAQHFQAAGCAKLAFKPKLTALADAKATRLGGAYLHVKLASQAGQANIAKVKLDFPKALPSRLTTLQGACREATFKADPANCPTSSVLGSGAVTTPFLRGLLTGPVYLVSHGSRAFPDLDAVLQGEGVTLVLTGAAGFANGISSDSFRSLPDAPISTLDLMFPAGPHSAFAANASLCNRKLAMGTEITGQNGAVIRQTNVIAVSGCHRKDARR